MTLKASVELERFKASPDTSVWMHYHGFQRRLYVAGDGHTSLPIQAWSGGGQTNAKNLKNRHLADKEHHTRVPVEAGMLDPFQAASKAEVWVKNVKGEKRHVSASRGGVLPPGVWIAVAMDAPGFRKPHSKIGALYWWLAPWRVDQAYAKAGRQLETFYIHIAGFLGSDAASLWTAIISSCSRSVCTDALTLCCKASGSIRRSTTVQEARSSWHDD